MARPKKKFTEESTEGKMETPKTMKVRVVGKDIGQVVGYSSDNTRIRAGEVIEIDPKMFSKRWMEKVDAEAESVRPDEEGRKQTAFSKTNPITGERKD